MKYNFAIFYFSTAVGSAFQSLYENQQLQQHMGDFWARVATQFKTNKNVVGMQLRLFFWNCIFEFAIRMFVSILDFIFFLFLLDSIVVMKYLLPFFSRQGYELLNEPWAGDVYRNLRQLEPGYTDLHFLQPLYDYLNGRIRETDPECLQCLICLFRILFLCAFFFLYFLSFFSPLFSSLYFFAFFSFPFFR
jgi:hypothetical protein